MCVTQTQVIRLALLPEQHTPQVMSPSSVNMKVVQTLSPADGGDEDLKGIENLQFGQAPACLAPEEYGLESVWGDPGTVHRAAQRRRVHGDVPVPQQGHPDNTQNLFHQVRDDWRSQSYRALHYQHEQFEIAVQEQQRVVCDQVEIAVALASRTAVQMTSRFRLISVITRQNSYRKTLLCQFGHSKLSDTLWFKNLQQR